MRPINLYEFYDLGNELHAIARLPDEPTLGLALSPLMNGRKWLRQLLSGDLVDLTFSRAEASSLQDAINSALQRYHDDKGEFDPTKDWNEKHTSWEISIIKSSLAKFEHNLAAELRQTSTYVVARKDIFDTSRLVDMAESRIPDELRIYMNETGEKDLHDSGRCLAFNLPTASALHAARAVEGILADYWATFAGDRVLKNPTMNDYLTELEDDKKTWVVAAKPQPKTLRCLREIKDLDRNRLMHPRETFDETEALIFFNLATSAIMQMTREMAALDNQGQGELVPLEAAK